MHVQVENSVGVPLLAGIVEVSNCMLDAASASLQAESAALVARIVGAGRDAEGNSAYISAAQRQVVRRLLKGGGFSPTGRNRPAQELLVNLVLAQGQFPHIGNAVDVNNLLSLEARLPISLLDADKVGKSAALRWGREGESFVFNQSGHSLDVKRCLVVAGERDEPLGSPIKDSMAGKVFPGCTRLLGIIYASADGLDQAAVADLAKRFAGLLARETGGTVEQACVIE